MFSLSRPTPADLALVTAEQADRDLTYGERGATRESMPAGYHRDHWEADLGAFDATRFDRLSAALLDWQVQCGAGLSVYPAEHPEQGEEAFHLVREDSRTVLRITAFSRPRHPLVRAGAPVGRLVQLRMNQAYLRAMRSATSGLRP